MRGFKTIGYYQQALSKLYAEALFSATSSTFANMTAENKNIMQELVDKNTPMEVHVNEDDREVCPRCGGSNIRTGYSDDWDIWHEIQFTHCGDCDQKLDWYEVNTLVVEEEN